MIQFGETQEYGGFRVRFTAELGQARIPLQADIGFGDAVTPAASEVDYPTLLDHPSPRLRAYNKETMIAEKLQAMAALGMLNSRMKDFHDVWFLSETFGFAGAELVAAVVATFEQRQTSLPDADFTPFRPEFLSDPVRAAQWKAFQRRTGLATSTTLEEALVKLRLFAEPVFNAAAENKPLSAIWPPGGPWGSNR